MNKINVVYDYPDVDISPIVIEIIVELGWDGWDGVSISDRVLDNIASTFGLISIPDAIDTYLVELYTIVEQILPDGDYVLDAVTTISSSMVVLHFYLV